MDLVTAAEHLRRFSSSDLGLSLMRLERDFAGLSNPSLRHELARNAVDHDTLEAAAILKTVAGQVNVVIHALGILLCLPHLLQENEKIESLSLGAGNTGKPFDLETDRRVAEFKFISWRGGPEAIRQNSLFKDLYYLAEHETSKSRHLYVLGTTHALKFLTGGRALSSVLSGNDKLKQDFASRYPDYHVVSDYYLPRRDLVFIEDVSHLLPELAWQV